MEKKKMLSLICTFSSVLYALAFSQSLFMTENLWHTYCMSKKRLLDGWNMKTVPFNGKALNSSSSSRHGEARVLPLKRKKMMPRDPTLISWEMRDTWTIKNQPQPIWTEQRTHLPSHAICAVNVEFIQRHANFCFGCYNLRVCSAELVWSLERLRFPYYSTGLL